MPDTAYKDRYDEYSRPQGAFELIHSIDKNVRDISSELYVFRREANSNISELKQRVSSLEAANVHHDKTIDKLSDDVSELKQDVKELRRDVNDIKGDIKALAAGFGATQNKFNWGLVILGLFVALIQLLK